MAKKEWFRLDHNVVDDPKIGMMPVQHQLMWFKILCLASANESRRGFVDLADEEIAFKMHAPLDNWLTAKEAFIKKGLINASSGAIAITDWDKNHVPVPREYSGGEYRIHSRFVFERDGYECVYCGSQDNLTLDHVVPQSKGGSHDPENLVCCCKRCNSSKGAKLLEEWTL